ncbi:hypothetical protein [Winogradskyella sp.]|uniref:hypothetical protein n=1 Tax=Winogradskyella sp. TaxID=1883156 RepID=UPI002638546B|nr:hypothetical protein [Winogradskyella sp.]
MNKFLKLYFTISVVIGTAIYVAQKQHFELPRIINNYVNDFLIVPICLTISLALLRLTRNDKGYYLRIYPVLYLALFYAVLFEFVLPQYYERYTSDPIDIILYFLSAILFYTLQRKRRTPYNWSNT